MPRSYMYVYMCTVCVCVCGLCVWVGGRVALLLLHLGVRQLRRQVLKHHHRAWVENKCKQIDKREQSGASPVRVSSLPCCCHTPCPHIAYENSGTMPISWRTPCFNARYPPSACVAPSLDAGRVKVDVSDQHFKLRQLLRIPQAGLRTLCSPSIPKVDRWLYIAS